MPDARFARLGYPVRVFQTMEKRLMNGGDELSPQAMALMTEVVARLAELRNVLILVGLATNRIDTPRSNETAAAALDKLRELSDAFNL